MKKVFKSKFCFKVLAVVAAGVKSSEETFADIDSLHSTKISLTQRVRAARLRSGNVKWWSEELHSTKDLPFTLLVFLTWSSGRTFSELLRVTDDKINTLNNDNLNKLRTNFEMLSLLAPFNAQQQKEIYEAISITEISKTTLYFISLRFPESTRNKYNKHVF